MFDVIINPMELATIRVDISSTQLDQVNQQKVPILQLPIHTPNPFSNFDLGKDRLSKVVNKPSYVSLKTETGEITKYRCRKISIKNGDDVQVPANYQAYNIELELIPSLN